jgi:malate synthase
VRHKATLDDGRLVDAALCAAILDEELKELKASAPAGHRYDEAGKLFRDLVDAPDFVEFLTLPAYEMIVAAGA